MRKANNLQLFARLLLGVTLLVASIAKLGDLQGFHDSLENLPFLHGGTAGLISVVLPNLELTLAVCLLVGMDAWPIDLAANLLFLCFTLVAVYWLRHGLHRGCACLGSPLVVPAAPVQILLRNAGLLTASSFLWIRSKETHANGGDNPQTAALNVHQILLSQACEKSTSSL
jgi:uncharacterized membrane protein YphA (DoxX/SURF4 family)